MVCYFHVCKHVCAKESESQREREFCEKRTADLRILRTAASQTHAEIQSQKRRGFRLNIHTAANPPSLTQTVISRYEQAYLYVFDRLHEHMHPNTTHMLNIRNFCVLTDVCVSTHLSLLHLNGWGQCRPTNTHATVCGSANAEPISYIDMARALMRESERDRERERERETERIKEKKINTISQH